MIIKYLLFLDKISEWFQIYLSKLKVQFEFCIANFVLQIFSCFHMIFKIVILHVHKLFYRIKSLVFVKIVLRRNAEERGDCNNCQLFNFKRIALDIRDCLKKFEVQKFVHCYIYLKYIIFSYFCLYFLILQFKYFMLCSFLQSIGYYLYICQKQT